MLVSLIASILDALLAYAPDEDLHSHLDEAMVRRSKALKKAADDLAFGG